MKGFASQGFMGRLGAMGDAAETAFEEWATRQGHPFVKWGFNRPPFTGFHRLPAKLRFTPDYIIQIPGGFRYVECKGTGGAVVKIKPTTIEHLATFNEELPVVFFVNDSKNNEYASVSFEDMQAAVQDLPLAAFHDGIAFYPIPRNSFHFRKKE